MIVPVVLAGGVGSRLWPISRASLPKQFISFPGQSRTLFQSTLSRLTGLEQLLEPVVVCNEEHRFLVAEQLRQLKLKDSTILLEPFGRNTAPAVALAALSVASQHPQAVLLVLPADHIIGNTSALLGAIEKGGVLASKGSLVTFGIVPDAPETGYGYIHRGDALPDSEAFKVAEFVEKPSLNTAKDYIKSGNYLWNSGMFMFRADAYLDELQRHAPDIFTSCEQAFKTLSADADFQRIDEQAFQSCRSDSIDYAVMEKTTAAAVIPLDAQWNDLGAWESVWEVAEKDDNSNALVGDVLIHNMTNSYIQADSRLVAAVGLDNVVIVETPDAVLVAAKDKVQQVKQIVEQLQAGKRSESEKHTLVYRPWGSYECLAQAEGYQLKHIIVNPGASLSLQMHHHRAEYWTVLKGEALVHCDGRDFILSPKESTFIPQLSKHRLSNTGDVPVEIIEVQLGDYVGEDDIVRLEDIYGRAK